MRFYSNLFNNNTINIYSYRIILFIKEINNLLDSFLF